MQLQHEYLLSPFLPANLKKRKFCTKMPSADCREAKKSILHSTTFLVLQFILDSIRKMQALFLLIALTCIAATFANVLHITDEKVFKKEVLDFKGT